ncbi:hypothetical protein H8959_022457 [Pygathrix nigripes]
MFCEKAMELIRELHRAPEGQLPAFNHILPTQASKRGQEKLGLWNLAEIVSRHYVDIRTHLLEEGAQKQIIEFTTISDTKEV